MRACFFVLSVSFLACATPPVTPDRVASPPPEGIATPLLLPPTHEDRRSSIVEAVAAAVEIKTTFARENGWVDEGDRSLFDRVEIFASQNELWQRVLELHDLPRDQPLPTKGLAAALEQRHLLAVTPELYVEIVPEYAQADPDAWARLLAHELVHRLHVEVLGGDEDAMGPMWFFEGFAVLGAGQSLDRGLGYASFEEALREAKDSASPLAYRRFVAAARFFAARIPLSELVLHAGGPDFEAWLERRSAAGASSASP